MRLLSICEAATITGPVKPLLMFSKLARAGIEGYGRIEHTLLTTTRLRGTGSAAENELLRTARHDGLEVDIVPERFLFDPAVLVHMGRSIRRRAPDVVETHDFKSHFLFWLLRCTGALKEPRWVAFHHGYTRMSRRVRMYQQLDRLSLRQADSVITLCRPFVEQLTARGVPSGRVVVVSNTVAPRPRPAPEELSALRASLGIAGSDTLILSVGRLSAEKGHADLIRAFRTLRTRGCRQDIRLVLVGDGGERAALAAEAADLGDRVLLVGHQPDPWPYFCIANLFVLPSYTEGSPLALLEAMAAGLPIVATAVGGVPELVTHATSALLVAPGDVAQLTCALSTLIEDSARARLLGTAAQRALRSFSPEAYASRLMAVYRRVVTAASSAPPVST
jgi:glycosyltransferase involved in cell wall biosynthesis